MPVKAAVREYTLDVTEEDIALGIRGCKDDCPIARAYRRQHPNLERYYTLWLTDEMQIFAKAFDGGEPAHPTTFTFDNSRLFTRFAGTREFL
jgi:hypothetical protein